ncbi:hypothetical protein GPECTOR_37g140 [Gonium pectorale]|uniref:Glycosyltransferase family 92 protein n=1 Tax=Gonium pectorale TaxID=33097 RepID=A0A150GC52_GONPE|nr:hypothetical protein GPECTOR_37g140 [Gonium pectorale]|eukprot:KXZ47135.1 hypothetical protein GPECTOR_37g140 [Gonium pectorale]
MIPTNKRKQRAIRALVWADDVENLHLRVFGHLLLPTSHQDWRPQLALETSHPGPVITAILETRADVVDRVGESRMRPYSLRFDLPDGTEAETCFKLVESSYPGHKVPVCVPHEDFNPADSAGGGSGAGGVGGSSGRSRVCESLAPATRGTNASAPALWMVVGPPRQASSSSRLWRSHYGQVAIRTAHFLSYHAAMGVSGLLLYADATARFYLRRHPALAPYLQSGHLRLVTWDMPERGHRSDEPHRRGAIRSRHGVRPLGYNYDQALFAGHALLGLSACGANIAVLITDLDEYLHTPSFGKPWPAPLAAADCLSVRHSRQPQSRPRGGGGPAAIITARSLPRVPVLASQVRHDREWLLWVSLDPPAAVRGEQPAGVAATAAAAAAASGGTGQVRRDGAGGGDKGGGGGGGGGGGKSASRAKARQLQQAGGGGGGGGDGGRGSSGGAVSAAVVGSLGALRAHPLAVYDRRATKIHAGTHGKMLVLPAAEVVAFFVHEGVPRHGSAASVDSRCMTLLHVSNFWRPRNNGTSRAKAAPRSSSRSGGGAASKPSPQQQPYVPFSWEGSPLAGAMREAAVAFSKRGGAVGAG